MHTCQQHTHMFCTSLNIHAYYILHIRTICEYSESAGSDIKSSSASHLAKSVNVWLSPCEERAGNYLDNSEQVKIVCPAACTLCPSKWVFPAVWTYLVLRISCCILLLTKDNFRRGLSLIISTPYGINVEQLLERVTTRSTFEKSLKHPLCVWCSGKDLLSRVD